MPEIVLLKLFKSNDWQSCAVYFLGKKMRGTHIKKKHEDFFLHQLCSERNKLTQKKTLKTTKSLYLLLKFIHISPSNLKFLLKVEMIGKWVLKRSIFQVNIYLPVEDSKNARSFFFHLAYKD